MGLSKQELADKTKLSQSKILAMVDRILGKPRGEPILTKGKADAVGRFLSAMQTAIGDGIGWSEGERVLLHDAPEEALEVSLCRNAIKYPASIRKGHPTTEIEDMNDTTSTATQVEATPEKGRRSKLSGKRMTYVGENTRRPGTKSHASIQVLIDNPGLTLEEFEAKGGRRQDILWDLKQTPDSVRLEDA